MCVELINLFICETRSPTRLCVDVPQFCSAIQTKLKGSSMDN